MRVHLRSELATRWHCCSMQHDQKLFFRISVNLACPLKSFLQVVEEPSRKGWLLMNISTFTGNMYQNNIYFAKLDPQLNTRETYPRISFLTKMAGNWHTLILGMNCKDSRKMCDATFYLCGSLIKLCSHLSQFISGFVQNFILLC